MGKGHFRGSSETRSCNNVSRHTSSGKGPLDFCRHFQAWHGAAGSISFWACTISCSATLVLMIGMRPFGAFGLVLVLVLQHQCFLAAAASRNLLNTFPYVPPTAVRVQPLSAPTPNSHVLAAPMPMGQRAPASSWMPAAAAPAPAQQQFAAQQHMRMAAPNAGMAAAATADIPFAPAIPFNPNSIYRQQVQQQGQQQQVDMATSGPIPESHPVGMLATPEPAPARTWTFAGLLNSGARTLASLAKQVWQQHGAEDAPSSGTEQVSVAAQGGPSDNDSNDYTGQSTVSTAAAAPASRNAFVAPWSNSVLPSNWQPQQGTVQSAADSSQPVRAVPAAVASKPAAAAGVMSAGSRSRLAGPSEWQQNNPLPAPGNSMGAPALAAAAAAQALQQPIVTVGQPAMQPLSPGITSMAKNNMGAPVAGPLGGPTYMATHQQQQPAAGGAVAVASTAGIGSFSSAPAPLTPSDLGSVQQHFASSKPPQYAPLSPILHVAAPQGSKGRGSSTGPSIDDISAATNAPVAQVTWQLPKKVHVAFAPAAEFLKAAPVSMFELPSSMRSSTDSIQVNRGAVTHHLTPTWVPAA